MQTSKGLRAFVGCVSPHCFRFSSWALAFRCVDQSQETIGSTTLSFGATNRLVAQTFIVGVTGQLTSISVDVFGASCSINGNAGEAYLIVTTTSGGLPTTTQLISGLILPPATDPGVLTQQNFLTQVAVTKGDVLAIEVRSDAAPCFVRLGPNGDSYLSGNAYTFNETSSTWSCLCSGPQRLLMTGRLRPGSTHHDAWISGFSGATKTAASVLH